MVPAKTPLKGVFAVLKQLEPRWYGNEAPFASNLYIDSLFAMKSSAEKSPESTISHQVPAQMKSMTPPQFSVAASPIQRDEKDGAGIPSPDAPAPTTSPGTNPTSGTTPVPGVLPNPGSFQLTPPNLLGPSVPGIDPRIMAEMDLMQSLRTRTPFGASIPDEWLLNMWSISPDDTYDWSNGESGRRWDLLSPEQIDEQMLMQQVLNRRFPTDQGWRFGLNKMGLGPSYRYGENELNFGLSPYQSPDPALEYPFLEPNEDAPLIDGGTLGIRGNF